MSGGRDISEVSFEKGIRLATPSDSAALSAIYAPIVETTATSFETTVPTSDEMAQRVSDTLLTHPWLVCENDEGVAGYAYGCPHRTRAAYRWSCDVSVYVDERARGQGMGRRLYDALFPLLKRQGFVRAHAGIVLPNAASVALHEGCGFGPVGIYKNVGYKFGQWRDVGWWALTLNDPEATPLEPIPWADISRQFSI
ncbi:MAG: arsinothricin resistance N-acetyltransferase ArsN1 family B [Pseudomonadota bacterium]